MEDNNKKKKNKYYYKYHNKYNNHYNHNNHSKNNKKKYQYYYKKNKKNKHNYYVDNKEIQKDKEENILLSQQEQILQDELVKEQEQQTQTINEQQTEFEIIGDEDYEQEEYPKQNEEQSKPIVNQVLEANHDYEEIDSSPFRNEYLKKYKLKKKYLYALGVFVIIAILFGVSYSFFTYTKVDTRQADIASGEVYVRIEEQAVNLSLNKMYPRTSEEARARNDNYIDFTIDAKNTSPTKELAYAINITNGENVQGKTRINPQYISLDLQEKVGNEYQYVKNAVPLSSFSFSDIVPINTTSEITREFRLRIWVNDTITISDTEANASYTQSQFANLYANIHIEVNSVDQAHVITAMEMMSNNVLTPENPINFANISSSSNGEGLYILPGTENDTNPIYYYRGNVTDNNVIFGDFCWKIIRTTDTGGIKMIYNGEITGNGETCENTSPASTQSSQGSFNQPNSTLADVGYMRNNSARYARTNAAGETGAIYGKNVEWDGTNYLVIEDTANVASSNTTKDNNHHYSCGTAGTTSCASVRYYYYNNYYITLTNGEKVEDALYKMTGNGDATVKARNQGYVLNQNNSIIKTAIESWFRTNLTNEEDSTKRNYVSYLEDTVFCNDRSFKTVSGDTSIPTYLESGWNPNGGDLTKYLYFGSMDRYNNNWYSTTNVPSMTCPNETDRFSVSSSIAHLNYPVGLITADEIILSGIGGTNGSNITSFYLYTGNSVWSMSPYDYASDGANGVYFTNNFKNYGTSWQLGYRPVISLKAETIFETGGEGTTVKPYVVKYE